MGSRVRVPYAPRITLIIRKFYKKHPEKYPLFTFPGVFVCFSAETLGLPSIFNNFIADVKPAARTAANPIPLSTQRNGFVFGYFSSSVCAVSFVSASAVVFCVSVTSVSVAVVTFVSVVFCLSPFITMRPVVSDFTLGGFFNPSIAGNKSVLCRRGCLIALLPFRWLSGQALRLPSPMPCACLH